METEILTNQETNTEEPKAGEPKTFTQEDVDRIVAKRVSRYSDYETLKEKAAKFDEIIEAEKSDLQKANERADSLQAELEALKSAEAIRNIRDEVANTKGVPVGLLTGKTKEECEAQAEALLEWASPNGYPAIPDGGDPMGHGKKSTREQFAEWLDSI